MNDEVKAWMWEHLKILMPKSDFCIQKYGGCESIGKFKS